MLSHVILSLEEIFPLNYSLTCFRDSLGLLLTFMFSPILASSASSPLRVYLQDDLPQSKINSSSAFHPSAFALLYLLMRNVCPIHAGCEVGDPTTFGPFVCLPLWGGTRHSCFFFLLFFPANRVRCAGIDMYSRHAVMKLLRTIISPISYILERLITHKNKRSGY